MKLKQKLFNKKKNVQRQMKTKLAQLKCIDTIICIYLYIISK